MQTIPQDGEAASALAQKPDNKIKISDLCAWSAPKELDTQRGKRILRTAAPNEAFSKAWKSDKDALKAAGLSWSRDQRTGEWKVCWWQAIDPVKDAADLAAKEAALASSRATDCDIEIPIPEGLAFLNYQKAGIAYALNRTSVLIADEPGLGKTPQTVGIINCDLTIQSVLVICPASLKINWTRELRRFLTRKFTIDIANGRFPNADIVVANYDIVKKHHAAIRTRKWDMLVLDESHYLKNPKAIRTQEILGSRKDDIQGIQARRRVCLTGTPIVNRPIELWPIIESLDPAGLGKNFFAFAKRYCNGHQIQAGRRTVWDFTGASHLDELQERLRTSVMVRRLKKDVLTELPPKRRQVIEFPADDEVRAIIERQNEDYEEREEEMEQLRAQVELSKASDNPADYENAVNALTAAMRVAFDSMSATRHEMALAKVETVISHLKDALEASEKIVCFAWHKDVIERIAAEFGAECVTLTGDTPMQARQDAVDRFQKDSTCKLFAGNIKAAGVGLTLTAASHVVFAELDWTPGNVTQAEDRCHRIGQHNSVLVQHLVLEGSLDSKMAKTIVGKQKVIDKALDTITEQAPATSQPELIDEITLSTPKQIAEESKQIPQEKRELILRALRIVAGMDADYARERNGVGFNKFDGIIGHSLAEKDWLSPKAAALGLRMARKYRKQLPAEIVDTLGLNSKMA